MGQRRISQTKVSKIRRRTRRKKTRLNFLQRIGRAVDNVFSKIGNVFLRSRGVSYVQQRFSFGRVTLESTVTVLTVFLLSIILLSVLVYPKLFTDFAVGLYSGNSAFHGFMLKTFEVLQGIGGVFAPIADGLRAIAPGFRNAFEGLVSSRSQPLTGGDLLGRYVFCQNAATWISAFAALAYGRFVSNSYRSRKR